MVTSTHPSNVPLASEETDCFPCSLLCMTVSSVENLSHLLSFINSCPPFQNFPFMPLLTGFILQICSPLLLAGDSWGLMESVTWLGGGEECHRHFMVLELLLVLPTNYFILGSAPSTSSTVISSFHYSRKCSIPQSWLCLLRKIVIVVFNVTRSSEDA